MFFSSNFIIDVKFSQILLKTSFIVDSSSFGLILSNVNEPVETESLKVILIDSEF